MRNQLLYRSADRDGFPATTSASDEARERLILHEIGYRPISHPLLVLPEYSCEMDDAAPDSELIDYVAFDGADHGTVLTAAEPVIAAWLDTTLPA